MFIEPEGRRRALVVVSAYRPAMIADMQRARMLAWELPALGWDVEVLTPRVAEVREDVIEPEPSGFFAPDTPVHEAGSLPRRLLEAIGTRNHGWRTLLSVRAHGLRLLRARRFDLVFFTTTTFQYFWLGPQWKHKCGVPFVLDFHDPWIRDREAEDRERRLRSRAAAMVAKRMEEAAVLEASGIVAVSPHYVGALDERYASRKPAWLAAEHHPVIPFGALESDFAEAAKDANLSRTRDENAIVIRYVGAGGAIMRRSFELICHAVSTLRKQGSELAARVRLELFGTTYGWKSGDPKELLAVAMHAGLGNRTVEDPERVSYRRSLLLLMESDAAMILGVDDEGYMPSKLFTYALAGKPLLAALRRDGPGYAQFQAVPDLGHALAFDAQGAMPIADAAAIVERFLHEAESRRRFDRRCALEPFLAPAMALRHARLFDKCVDVERSRSASLDTDYSRARPVMAL